MTGYTLHNEKRYISVPRDFTEDSDKHITCNFCGSDMNLSQVILVDQIKWGYVCPQCQHVVYGEQVLYPIED